jgi:RHS repeat-associated protein
VVALAFRQCSDPQPGRQRASSYWDFRQDDDGAGWDLVQSRTANTVNEITDITESTGAAWITPLYNRAGNMTRVPKPSGPTNYYACTYDAWNRLVKLTEGANTVAEYAYDGAKRRTVKKTYSGGALDETRHFYYTEPSKWQVIEERVNSSTDPDRQFVWGERYVDELILRDRDTDANGTLDERLYALQDANWNLTAIAATDGTIQERYAYSAYGTPVVLTPAFGSRASSSYAWETRFAGYRWDDEVRLYQVRNRVLRPQLGWLQRDPADLSGVTNLYEYVGSNPGCRTDHTGAFPHAGLAALLALLAACAAGATLAGLVETIVQLLETIYDGPRPPFGCLAIVCAALTGCLAGECAVVTLGAGPPGWIACAILAEFYCDVCVEMLGSERPIFCIPIFS